MIAQALGLLLFCMVMVGGPAVIWHAFALQRDQRALRKMRECHDALQNLRNRIPQHATSHLLLGQGPRERPFV